MRTLKSEVIQIAPFKKIYIGDDLYFQELQEARKVGDEEKIERLEKLVVNGATIQKVKFSAMKIQEIEDSFEFNGKTHYYKSLFVLIGQASREDILKSYMRGNYVASQVMKKWDLGCDTASFLIGVNDGTKGFRQITINTLGDGRYGTFLKMRREYGMLFTFEVDEDAYSYQKLKEKLIYLFGEKTK